jgi:hypothetical protein
MGVGERKEAEGMRTRLWHVKDLGFYLMSHEKLPSDFKQGDCFT